MSNAQTDNHRRIAVAAFGAWQRGEAPITEIFAPQMTWRIEGHSAASGQYRSTQEFVDRVLAPSGRASSTASRFDPSPSARSTLTATP